MVIKRPGVSQDVGTDEHRRRPVITGRAVTGWQRLDVGVVELGRSRLVIDLETEGGVAVGAGPTERRTDSLHDAVSLLGRRINRRLDWLRGIINRERRDEEIRVEVLHRAGAVDHRIVDGGHVPELDAFQRLEVGAEVVPVETVLAAGDEVAFEDVIAGHRIAVAAEDNARLEALGLTVDADTDDADDVIGRGRVGEALTGCLRSVRHLDVDRRDLIPADLDILDETDRIDTWRVDAVTVLIHPRDKRGLTFVQDALIRFGQRNRQLIILHRRQHRLVIDAEEELRHRDKRIGHEVVSDRRKVDREVAGDHVDFADT